MSQHTNGTKTTVLSPRTHQVIDITDPTDSTSDNRQVHYTIDTQQQYNKHSTQFWYEYILVCCVVLLAESSRGLVIPTLSGYIAKLGGGEFILSTAVSLYSIGRLLMTSVFGYVGDAYSTRTLLQFSMLVCIIGNIVYISADIAGIQYYGLYLLLASRALTGCGTAVMSVARSHVAATTDVYERTTFISYLGIVSFIGFSFSPALGGLGFESSFAGIPIAVETVSTYVLAGLDIILAIVIQIVMSNVMITNRVPSHKQLDQLPIDKKQLVRQDSYRFDSRASIVPWIYVILNLTGRGVLSISESYATLLYYKVAGDDSESAQRTAGYWFTVFGICGVCVNFTVPYLERYISDLRMLKLSLTTGTIGFILLCSWNGVITYTQYVVGMFMIWGISCPLNQTLAVSMLSKHLGNAKQARWMALVTASGSVGRIICPLVSGTLMSLSALKDYDQNSAYIFAAALTLMSYLLAVSFLHTEVDKTRNEDEIQIAQTNPLLSGRSSPTNKYDGTQ